MQQNKVNILCTNLLEDQLVGMAKKVGIDIDPLPFIETSRLESKTVLLAIKNSLAQSATVIFTSVNAVEAVAVHMQKEKPDWKIYCIGIVTNKAVKKYFGEHAIAGTATNASELAGLIVAEGGSCKVSFFCGDQRRDALPNILRKNGIRLHEITVYQTIATPQKIDKPYHGILFFSPSAVDSFFSLNSIPISTILFAIGNTTANEIKKHTHNCIIVGVEHGKEMLVKRMMEYYQQAK
ncbi:MAG: uroporphyrinogen-III synthase [Sediminibacterium sp.]|nr:uroporphyrinogen-III synthase [Sediminibacterium sp.]MDP3666148.1 uroporphyrinogen-III synthase [Sediminibacterium sp.]